MYNVCGGMAVLGKNIGSQLQNQFNAEENNLQRCNNPTLAFMYTEKMSSCDDSDDIADPLSEELRNIQSVIFITRENIDALNAKFANFQEPPPMYIAEYQDLTSRLHELELKEHELVDQLQQQQDEQDETEEHSADIVEASCVQCSEANKHETRDIDIRVRRSETFVSKRKIMLICIAVGVLRVCGCVHLAFLIRNIFHCYFPLHLSFSIQSMVRCA